MRGLYRPVGTGPVLFALFGRIGLDKDSDKLYNSYVLDLIREEQPA